MAPGQQKAAEASSSLGAFELLDRSALEHVTSMRGKARPPPVSKDEWNTFFNAAGAACLQKCSVLMRGPEPRAVWGVRGAMSCRLGAMMQSPCPDSCLDGVSSHGAAKGMPQSMVYNPACVGAG